MNRCRILTLVPFGIGLLFATNQHGNAEDEKHWRVEGRVQHGLIAAECPREGVGHLTGTFLAADDIAANLAFLTAKSADTQAELRALCRGLKLRPRDAVEGVQADARVALLWYDLEDKSYHSSNGAKRNEFVSDRDRLAAVLVVLDSRAVNKGAWVEAERIPIALPPRWTANTDAGGFGLPSKLDFERHWAPGSILDHPIAGVQKASFGHAVVEPDGFIRPSRLILTYACEFLQAHPNETVAVLAVYQYEGKNPRVVSDYRLDAVDASGKFGHMLTNTTVKPGSYRNEFTSLTNEK